MRSPGKPVKARWLRILGRGSDRTEWNSIWEVACPALVKGEGNATASGTHQAYTPAKAVDGWISGDNVRM